MTKNTKVMLFAGASVFIFAVLMASIIAGLFYFHILNLANVVTGGR